jgi:outer membrane receptor protein involved in Fe transport
MTTESNPILKRAVRLALLAGSAAAIAVHPTAAKAQAASSPTGEDNAALSEVVVTGSRIASPSLDSISPVTAVSSEEFKETGVTRVEDLLNSLPQVTADQGSGLSMTANCRAVTRAQSRARPRPMPRPRTSIRYPWH